MKATFALTPAESKRLLAKAVVQMDEVKQANEKGYVIIAGGTTNGFVAQELLGMDVDQERFTAGIVSRGVFCVTPDDKRANIGLVVHQGKIMDMTMVEAFEDFHPETIVIKGGNAVDPEGNVGVISAGFDGGTVGNSIGYLTSTGMKYVSPVGLEKLVPSVKQSAIWTGAKTFDYSMGADYGIFCIVNAIVVTEIQALKILADVEAVHVASGGVGGSEGAVILVMSGEEANIKKAMGIIESIKGEPPVKPLNSECATCPYNCVFQGKERPGLPTWLTKG
jgi:hypothetical protein